MVALCKEGFIERILRGFYQLPHINQKDKLVLVPVLPLKVYEGNLVELKKNKVIDYMYIPDGNLIDMFDLHLLLARNDKILCDD